MDYDFYEPRMPKAMKFIWGLTLVGGLLGISLFMYILFVAFLQNPALRNKTSIPELKNSYAYVEVSKKQSYLHYDEEDEEEAPAFEPAEEPASPEEEPEDDPEEL